MLSKRCECITQLPAVCQRVLLRQVNRDCCGYVCTCEKKGHRQTTWYLIAPWVLVRTCSGLPKRQRFHWQDINTGAAKPLCCAEGCAGPDAWRRACSGKCRCQDADCGLQWRRGAACRAQEPALSVAGREDGHRARSHVACRSATVVLEACCGALRFTCCYAALQRAGLAGLAAVLYVSCQHWRQ